MMLIPIFWNKNIKTINHDYIRELAAQKEAN